MTMFRQDEDGIHRIGKVGNVRSAVEPKTEHGKRMRERSDDRLREMVRALDARERQIVIDTLNEA